MGIALSSADTALQEIGIDRRQQKKRGRIERIIEQIIDQLPPSIKEARTLTRKCAEPTNMAIEMLNSEEGIALNDLEQIRNAICLALRMRLYEEFIRDMTKKMNVYMSKNEPPETWGLGYLAHMEDWGNDFYHKWRDGIAKTDPEEAFRTHILPKLPTNWQEKFKPKIFCEHDWGTLKHVEIANILNGLRKRRTLKGGRWGLGTVENWINEKGERVGMSFYNFLIRTYGSNASTIFEETILPHILPDLRETFEHNEPTRCPYEWRKMTTIETARILIGLTKAKDPATHSWGFASIEFWTGPNGELWGKSFCSHWYNKGLHEQQFAQKILRYFPENWRPNFKGAYDRS
ncbi:MAG: hypothetical protein UW03_C0036G0007 [Candidatus Peregrinibacteria bacterium GW2011_GWA2_43_8]|nr:MAG: hypothetical protein UW03_C0036G0007 [Candidatus Peregrinibacteria bacterium GW2011_GWA2_43_8]